MGEPGGGIRNQGILILNNCEVSENRTGDGAVYSMDNGGYGGPGAGIYILDGILILNNSEVVSNLTVNGATGDRGGNGGLGGMGGGI